MTSKRGSAPLDVANQNSGECDVTAIELWDKAQPKLEKALGYYDKVATDLLRATADTTDFSSWFGQTRASYKQEIEKIIDTVLQSLRGIRRSRVSRGNQEGPGGRRGISSTDSRIP